MQATKSYNSFHGCKHRTLPMVSLKAGNISLALSLITILGTLVATDYRYFVSLKLDVRFEIFTAVTMENVVFWDVVPCAGCSRWFLTRGIFYRENGVDTFLRNVGSIHKIYTFQKMAILNLDHHA
jgi:hypothetical protein